MEDIADTPDLKKFYQQNLENFDIWETNNIFILINVIKKLLKFRIFYGLDKDINGVYFSNIAMAFMTALTKPG